MSELPVNAILPELLAKLAGQSRFVLEAPPGAGKSTQVPLALLKAPELAGQSILMLEPRRLAARSLARYLASCLGEKPGQSVGYRTRQDSAVGPDTRLEIVTEGILVRRLQHAPLLEGVGMVIFDEFHERNLQGDLALALSLDVQQGLRDDLKLLVMSATLEGARLAEHLGGAVRLQSQGRSYPVAIRHVAPRANQRWLDLCRGQILGALAAEPGSVLVFLPGGREIRYLARDLEGQLPDDVDCYPLFGDLDRRLQDQAIAPPEPGRRKLVLATPIAETSLTIEGIRVVIDSGWCRRPKVDPGTGLTRLETVRISQASSTQRAGRAGRLEPGVAVRLWGESQQQSLAPQDQPEILEAELSALVLELAAWGTGDPAQLDWLDAPPAKAVQAARTLLQALDAIDDQGRISAQGRAMARLGCHPRLAHMLCWTERRAGGSIREASLLAALLEEKDPFPNWDADIEGRLAQIKASSPIGRQAQHYQRRLKAQNDYRAEPGLLLAMAFPERVAREVAPGRYRMASGRAARLAEGDRLWGQPHLVVAAASDSGGDGLIRLAAPLALATWLPEVQGHLAWQPRLDWDKQAGRLLAVEELRFGQLVLETRPLKSLTDEQRSQALCDWIRRQGLQVLPWDDGCRQLQARVQCARDWLAEESWPDLGDQALLTTLEDWLGPFLGSVRKQADLQKLPLLDALKAALPWPLPKRLDEALPRKLTVPTGQSFAIDYVPGQAPALSVPIQAMYGQLDSPRVADGKVVVTLALLSPARRPLQITTDLAAFWAGSYAEVRKEMRGRYPKHEWPDDPAQAKPTRFTKKQQQRQHS
ncbi:ATP-dependent helicase HrpB [Gallaecimonas sp. GXIMD4217]|uniref:ATP-dependent helicase HrpB n=1 Tax=Gallaecimonas sp. GXIMD4217 TaxID=3131927 RepID=UPI00311B1E7A